MLSSLSTGTTWAFQLPQEMRKVAAARTGAWEITTWETKWSWFPPVQTTLRLTELEFNNLVATARTNIATAAKENVLRGSLEHSASRLWKTGSLEDMSCRALAPELTLRWLRAGYVTAWGEDYLYLLASMSTWVLDYVALKLGAQIGNRVRAVYLLGPTVGVSVYLIWRQVFTEHKCRTTVRYLCDAPTVNSRKGGDKEGQEKKGPEGGGGDGKPPDVPSADPAVSETAERRALTQETADLAVRAEEQENLVTQEAHGRYRMKRIEDENICVVIGQDFDKSKEKDRCPDVGVVTMPCADLPNVYTNCAANVKAAIGERYHKKAKPCKLTADDKRKIGKLVKTAIGHKGMFSTERVRTWFERHFDLADMRSKKWSEARFAQAFESLLRQVDPEFQLKTSVKAEHMAEGKAPRFLIADGDAGQVMALAAVKCMEELLFDTMESHSIKHAHKAAAMKRILEKMVPPKKAEKLGCTFVEGDGSAWDTTCNATVRGCIENPVLEHISRILSETYIQPESWAEAHNKVNGKKELKLFFKKFYETVRESIGAIRRSGHRGTSVLNWWVNFCMWVCSLFESPEDFLNPEVRWSKDVAGVERWYYGAYEGDDSGVSTCPKLCHVSEDDVKKLAGGEVTLAELSDKYVVPQLSIQASISALAFWDRAGFNMKWEFAKQRGTIVGMHVGLLQHGLSTSKTSATYPNGIFCPELPRALKGATSCSPAMLEAVRKDDLKTIKTIASATALARAADFAGIIPTVSRKYLAYADMLDSTDFQDREMSIRTSGEDGLSAAVVRSMIQAKNNSVTVQEETAVLDALCYSATAEELESFARYPWFLSTVTQHDEFAHSLPRTWSVGGSV